MKEMNVWRGKRVFLTGHTGFKGGWLALWLEALGSRVHGYALDPPSRPSLFELAKVGKVTRKVERKRVESMVVLREETERVDGVNCG